MAHHPGNIVLAVVRCSLPKPGLLSLKKKKKFPKGTENKINSPGLQILNEASAQALGSLKLQLVFFYFMFVTL